MSALVDVLALLSDPHYDLRPAADFAEAHAAVDALVQADREYDQAAEALTELNRRIAQQGWIELEYSALRDAGQRFVQAGARRQDALAKFGVPA